jgi:hypothetical protein
MKKWEIFYTNYSIKSEDVPDITKLAHREDVQVIIQDGDNGANWETLSGTEYFYWDDKGSGYKWWRCNDLFGLYHYLRQPGEKCVLFGTWIEKKDFYRIFNEAREKWGDKGTFGSDERHP